jgi:hypothetical protein
MGGEWDVGWEGNPYIYLGWLAVVRVRIYEIEAGSARLNNSVLEDGSPLPLAKGALSRGCLCLGCPGLLGGLLPPGSGSERELK